MKNAAKLQITTPSDRELAMIRSFDAPRGLVWEFAEAGPSQCARSI
jgi:hypothetical protein